MGACQQCEQQIGNDYHYYQEANLESNQPLITDPDKQNFDGKAKLLNIDNQQRKIKSLSRFTTATTSSQENQQANSQEGRQQKETEIRPRQKQQSQMLNYQNYQQKISEEAESILSQLDEKLSKKNSSKQNQKIDSDQQIESTILSMLNKINTTLEEDFKYNKLKCKEQINFITEEINLCENTNDKSISGICHEDSEQHKLAFTCKSEESLENELEEENDLNKAFIYYDTQNNLNLSNICCSQNTILFNARLTYNPSIPPQFSRQISSMSKINQSNPFLPEQSSISKYTKNDQILINRMPTKTINQLQKRINYVKINYE